VIASVNNAIQQRAWCHIRSRVQTTSGRRWLSCLHKLLGSLHLAEAFLTAITPHHLLLMIGSDATPSGDRHTPAQLIKVGFDWIPLSVVAEMLGDEGWSCDVFRQ